jgi:hypothetical protein
MVGTLVTHLCEEETSLGGVAIGVSLFTLGVGLEIGELPLPGFLPATAIIQSV